jgi:UDP-glucose 4-epimerase
VRILVTGGAGYIGSVTVERLIAAGSDVIVFDNLCKGHLAAVHPCATFVMGDLLDRAAIMKCINDYRPDAIMHFAAHSLVGESMQVPFKYLGDNVMAGMNLLECAAHGDIKKFILSSTANLFDKPAHIPIDELEHIAPGSPYGESKYIMERMLHWMERIYGMKYAALRYFNAVGATEERGEDHTPELHLIPLVLQVALGKRSKITIYGDQYPTPDGTCVRDYIHVADLADAHIRALSILDKHSCVYNLGNGTGYSVKQVITCAREVTGHPIPSEIAPARAGDPAILVAASSKIRRELGWQPVYTRLHDMIKSAWDWHRAHPDGYKSQAPIPTKT